MVAGATAEGPPRGPGCRRVGAEYTAAPQLVQVEEADCGEGAE
jgi:hypothetical protein